MKWVPVQSTVFSSAAYRQGERQLYLRFHNGSIYRYLDCPPPLYEGFLAAESKGTYFGRNIRNVLRYEQVHRRTSGRSLPAHEG